MDPTPAPLSATAPPNPAPSSWRRVKRSSPTVGRSGRSVSGSGGVRSSVTEKEGPVAPAQVRPVIEAFAQPRAVGNSAPMQQLVPGIFHWTALNPSIGTRVSSYFVESAGAIIDPMVPEDGLDALPGRPERVLLSSGHHLRDSRLIADTYGIPICASRQAAEHLGAQGGAIDVWAEGEPHPAPGVTALNIGVLCEDEGALHPQRRRRGARARRRGSPLAPTAWHSRRRPAQGWGRRGRGEHEGSGYGALAGLRLSSTPCCSRTVNRWRPAAARL